MMIAPLVKPSPVAPRRCLEKAATCVVRPFVMTQTVASLVILRVLDRQAHHEFHHLFRLRCDSKTLSTPSHVPTSTLFSKRVAIAPAVMLLPQMIVVFPAN